MPVFSAASNSGNLWRHRATVFGDAKMTTALLYRLTHRFHILETGNDSFRFKASSAAAAQKKGEKANPLIKPCSENHTQSWLTSRLKNRLSSAWKPTAVDTEYRKARKCVCRQIDMVRRHNNEDTLDAFKEWYREFNCRDVSCGRP